MKIKTTNTSFAATLCNCDHSCVFHRYTNVSFHKIRPNNEIIAKLSILTTDLGVNLSHSFTGSKPQASRVIRTSTTKVRYFSRSVDETEREMLV